MIKYLVSITGFLIILFFQTQGQLAQHCIAYLNAQTTSLEEIQRQLAYLNAQKIGLPVKSSINSVPNYTKNESPQKRYASLNSYFNNTSDPNLEEIKTLVGRSEKLYQNIKRLSKKEALTVEDFQLAALLFEDIHILNQKIDHEIREREAGYTQAILNQESLAHGEILTLARKLLIAYRYELGTSTSKLSRELARVKVPSKKASQRFTEDFKRILCSRIEEEDLYNEKVLPAFNLWVDVYNEWIENFDLKLIPQLKLGPEFVPIQESKIEFVKSGETPQNIIFLLDISGSMRKQEKLPLLKKSLIQILPYLHKDDRIDILCFADNSQQIVSNYSPQSSKMITNALSKLEAAGNTQPYNSFEKAYQIASKNQQTKRLTRIIFLTDGGFEIDPARLPALIEKQRYEGISLNIVYSGSHEAQVRNRLRKLAEIGNGQYLALNNANPAQSLLQVVQQVEVPK